MRCALAQINTIHMNRDKYIIDRKNGICECKKHGRIWREGECFGERPMPNNVLGPACKDCVADSMPWQSNTMLPSVLTPDLRNQYIYGMAPSRSYRVRVTSTSTLTETQMNDAFEQAWRDET